MMKGNDLPFRRADGGRSEAGYPGTTSDCFVRALANYDGGTGADYERALEAWWAVENRGRSELTAEDRRTGRVPGSRGWHMSRMSQERGLVSCSVENLDPTTGDLFALVGNCVVGIHGHAYALVDGERLDASDGYRMTGRIETVFVDYTRVKPLGEAEHAALVAVERAKVEAAQERVDRAEASGDGIEICRAKRKHQEAVWGMEFHQGRKPKSAYGTHDVGRLWPYVPAVHRDTADYDGRDPEVERLEWLAHLGVDPDREVKDL